MSSILKFSKYHGCGNDFILIDNRLEKYALTKETILRLCSRRFGIGADGLMLLGSARGYDFSMKYYNSDGFSSTFCGNGGRCIVSFAKDLGIVKESTTTFLFDDTKYNADLLENGYIVLKMKDVKINDIQYDGGNLFFDTGSPHYIHFVESDIELYELIPYAKSIRYSTKFPNGINVNLVKKISDDSIFIRTYERGVEDETYSCGTGVTAAAIALNYLDSKNLNNIQVKTKGGDFEVSFDKDTDGYKNVKLIGPAEFVYQGEVEIEN